MAGAETSQLPPSLMFLLEHLCHITSRSIHRNKPGWSNTGACQPHAASVKDNLIVSRCLLRGNKGEVKKKKKKIMQGNSCQCKKLKVSSQGEEGWQEEPLHKTSITSRQGTSNLIFHSMVLFYPELSGLWGSFVSLWFFMNDLRAWVLSNFFPVFKEVWCSKQRFYV